MSSSVEKAKIYLERKGIPQLFEALITSLMYQQPDDHIDYLLQCFEKLQSDKQQVKQIKWDTFIDHVRPQPRVQENYAVRDSSQYEDYNYLTHHHGDGGAGALFTHEDDEGFRVKTGRSLKTTGTQERQKSGFSTNASRVQTPKTRVSHEFTDHVSESRRVSGTVFNRSIENIENIVDRVKSTSLRQATAEQRVKSARSARTASLRAVSSMATPFKSCEIICVIGGPGSGKGTQCEKLAEHFGFVHLSSGDLLRAEVNSGSELGREMSAIMKSGGLVPDDLILELLKSAMAAKLNESNRFLLDGYPRKVEQALQFERKVGPVSLALYLDVSDETMTSRLLHRALTSGRADDNEETIKHRLVTFHDSTEPVIDFYRRQGKLRTIPCERGPNEIFQDIEEILNNSFALRGKLIIFVIGGPGSGKGTQCDKIVQKYGFLHLSSGDLLRAEVESQSELGQSLNEIMREGKLVPLEVILSLLKTAILANSNKYNGFLIDGYPREVVQGERFESEIASCNLALYLHVSDEVMTARLLERGKTSGRVDDNEKTIQNRLNLFHQVTKPVVDYYTLNGKLKTVNSEQNVDEVFSDVEIIIDDLMFSLRN